MADRLDAYRRKRDFSATPEPVPARTVGRRGGHPTAGRRRRPRFVVQEHHARRLHFDLRLEHDGVLWSWAVPKGIPKAPHPDHLAVRTEDHPLEYLTFEGEIPRGQYGAGTMTIWDRGTYEPEKLRDDEVIVTFRGARVRGRYALFRTRGNDWMIHRMDPPDDPLVASATPMPRDLRPMLAVAADELPRDADRWAFEMKWDGMRALVAVEAGQVRVTSRQGNDATDRFPELRALTTALAGIDVVLDGEIVALDHAGRPSFERLQPRMQAASAAAARRLAAHTPVALMCFDVLWLEGQLTLELPYDDRRRLLEQLALSGPAWQTPPTVVGDGTVALQAAQDLGLEGVVAKRRDSPYQPGRRSPAWRKVKAHRGQELVVGGWLPGKGALAGRLGSLLVGAYDAPGGRLQFAGRVGSGITAATRRDLEARLAPLEQAVSPFVGAPRLPEATWVRPELVVEVRFQEWTRAGILRAPRVRGLRTDKDPRDVVREP